MTWRLAGSRLSALLPGSRSRALGGRGYREVVRWRHPAGEGRFVAVGPRPSREALLALGEALRWDHGNRDVMVVMVFDDARAAREVRRGSRYIGEARFQAALAHQLASYMRDRARGVHRFTIYDAYPSVRELVEYTGD